MPLVKTNVKEQPTIGLQSLVSTWPRSLDNITPGRFLAYDVAQVLRDFLSLERGLQPRHTFGVLGSAALDNIPLRLATFDREDLAFFTLAHTKTKFYELVGTLWTDRTRGTGAYAGADTQPWDSCVALNKYVFTNYVDKLQVWDGTTATAADVAAAGVGNSLEFVRAKYSIYFGGRLILANLKEESPTKTRALRLRWSKEGAFEATADWTALGSGAVDLAETPDEITGIAKLGNQLVVYKRRSIYHGIETQDITAPFNFELKEAAGLDKGTGLVSHFTIAELPNFHIGLFNDNVYIYDGTRILPVGDPYVKEIIRQTSPANLAKSFATVYSPEHQYIIWIPRAGEAWPSLAGVYDYRRDLWIGEIQQFASCAAPFVTVDGTTINQLVGTINAQVGTIDELSGESGSSIPAIGIPVGKDKFKVRLYDTTDYFESAEWRTGDLNFGFGGRFVSLSRIRLRVLHLESTVANLGCSISVDNGQSFLTGVNVAVQPSSLEQEIYFDLFATGKTLTLRFALSGGGLRILEFEPFFHVRGRIA